MANSMGKVELMSSPLPPEKNIYKLSISHKLLID